MGHLLKCIKLHQMITLPKTNNLNMDKLLFIYYKIIYNLRIYILIVNR